MDIKDVENLAELSKIELTEEEKAKVLKDMDGILDYVKQVESVEVPDMDLEYPVHNVWREDENNMREFSKEIIKEQFPDVEDDFVKVKKIL